MTSLRLRMLEDMQIRNLAVNTQESYVQQVSLFARYFHQSPERLGPEQIRAYQLYLTKEKKLATGSILIAISALRFLYKVTLKKGWTFQDIIPAPKKPQTLPVVLSPEEVMQFLTCVASRKHRIILTTCYAAGLRVSESIALTPPAIDSKRMVLRVEQGKGMKDRYVILSPKLLQILREWWRVERPEHWGADSNGQLFLVLNTESSFPLGIGTVIEELEGCQQGLGVAFYSTLRQGLYRWVRVYDDWDARNRIEQMVEWAEGEEDPDSYEIPKLEQDLPGCLRRRESAESPQSLDSFPAPTEPSLKELVETTLELHRISHSIDRPALDEEWLESQRSYHSLDLPLPAILLYFRPGDAVMACFDDECEYWGQETPEPNLIVPLRPNDSDSVLQALATLETLMRELVLTVRIKTLIEDREKSLCDSGSMSEANLR